MVFKLRNVRLAFPNLFKAASFGDSDDAAFNATFLIPKDDPQIKKLQYQIKSVAEEKWGDKYQATLEKLIASDKVPMRDGEAKEQYDGFAGCYYVAARNKSKVLVIDKDPNVELNESDGRPYAGCYVNASIDIWAQDNKYGKRINAKLRGVQFVKDGDAFSGSAPASSSEFDDLSVDEQENPGETPLW